MQDFSIILISNGPGELAAWVKPLVHALRQRCSGVRIIVALVPCPHRSGKESQFARRLHGVHVMSPAESTAYLLRGDLPKSIHPARQGLILQLGGDVLFGVGFKWRLGYPLTVYTEKWVQWRSQVSRYFFKSEQLMERWAPRLKPGQASLVGDLMSESLHQETPSPALRQRWQVRPEAPVVSLLPGSKPLKVLFSTGFFLQIVEEISLLMPEVQFMLVQSPFTPLHQLREAAQNPTYLNILGSAPAQLIHERRGPVLRTQQGNQVRIMEPDTRADVFSMTDLALTLPGTNTAELAYLGCPMMVLLPLNRPDLLPLDGVGQYLHRIPWLGKPLKTYLVERTLKQMPFLALPNMRAGREVVPEYRGKLEPESLAQEAVKLLQDAIKRRDLSRELKAVMPRSPAAQNLVEALVEYLPTSTCPEPAPSDSL